MANSGAARYLLLLISLFCSLYWLNKFSTRSSNVSGKDWASASTEQQTCSTVEQVAPRSTSSTVESYVNKQSFHVQPDGSEFKSPLLPDGYTAAFPRHIWQTSSEAGKRKYVDQIKTWKGVKGFDYHWLSDAEADEFVHKTFSATRSSLVAFWDDLSLNIKRFTDEESRNSTVDLVDSTASSSIVLRADLLRYMLMFARGGVYADIDTSALLHVDRWIPENLGSQVVNAVIGIEYDDSTYKMFVRPISFCQWTLLSKPGHPIFERAINRVVSNLQFLARKQKVKSLSQLKLDKIDVLEATGPGMISDVVLEVLQDQLPNQNISWATFHDQREGKLFGDVVILPVNGFAGNQKHSHSGDTRYGDKLVQHHFGRSWYHPARANST